MNEQLALVTAYAEAYGIFFVVPLVFLENIPIVGLFSPGVTVLFLAGFFSPVLPGGPLLIFFMIFITMVIADTFWYTMGYRYGTKFRFLRYIKAQSPTIAETVTKQPIKLLMFYQFVPYLRMFLPFSLGLFQYNIKKWLKTTIFGSFIFTSTYVGLGWGTNLWFKSLDDSSAIIALIPIIGIITTILFTIHLATKYLAQKKIQTETKSR
jgi:membrane protein DedA with SNARE-associated domain